MSTITMVPATRPATELDPALGDQLADELLVSVAATTRVGKVKRGVNSSGVGQRHNARAWTSSGSVD